ncbi:MAG: sodium:solute symporter family protein [Steroidobacteraceae bacterium]
MTPAATTLAVMFAIVAIGTAVGFLAGSRQRMDLEQWTVGGRRFGTVLVFLLMAGEAYTTFSFLGVSGWAYSRGGPALYVLAYITLAYVTSFFILPQLWELGRRHQLQTQPDFFNTRYRNRYLTGFVCVVGILAFIPYVQLQLLGVGIIVSVASFGHIGRVPAMTVAALLVVAFVFANGVRAVAWVSVVKDALMIIAAVAIGIGIPLAHFGGVGAMFHALAHAHPGHLMMPGATANLGHSWFISTVLLSALGGYMWPHLFGAAFTAKSADTLRRNAVVMPLYTLTLALMFFAGFATVLIIPHLRDGDLALLTVARQTFPPWFLGVIGGAGALTAMVPAAILILTAATLFAKNLYRPLFAPALTDDGVTRLARAMVVLLGAVSLALAVRGSSTIVSLLLTAYAVMAQCFPGVVLGLYWGRVTGRGVFIGMIVGVVTAASLMGAHLDPVFGLNAGFVGLCVNLAVAVMASLLFPAKEIAEASAAHAATTTSSAE